jgi:hypothetical protein
MPCLFLCSSARDIKVPTGVRFSNAMVAPFTQLPIRGIIWYQGETNSALNRVSLYGKLFPAMIQDWRNHWHQGNFPSLFAQISGFDNPKENWGFLRDSQRRTLYLANIGMAITLDFGDEHNVHPENKQIVGERLSLLARHIVFGEDIVSSGPLFRLAYPSAGAMHVWFDNAAGLNFHGAPAGFEIAGPDEVFCPSHGTHRSRNCHRREPRRPRPTLRSLCLAQLPDGKPLQRRRSSRLHLYLIPALTLTLTLTLTKALPSDRRPSHLQQGKQDPPPKHHNRR